jgi:hypothetical protein
MKKFLIILAFLPLVGFFSCSKQSNQITLVRDCTGTYARIGSDDWLICNYADITDYADGTVMDIDFIQLQECSGSEPPEATCFDFHESRGNIRISAIH